MYEQVGCNAKKKGMYKKEGGRRRQKSLRRRSSHNLISKKREKKYKNNASQQVNICAFCNDPLHMEDVTRSVSVESCIHRFHLECIALWWQTTKDDKLDFTCPECRKPIQVSKEPDWRNKDLLNHEMIRNQLDLMKFL